MEFLSNEVLLEIFVYLDQRDLRNVMLVNRSFQELISQSQKMMQKFTLNIDFRNIFWNCFGMEICLDKSIDALMSSTRRFQNLSISNIIENGYVTKMWEQVDEFLRKFRGSLANVEFVDCEFSTLDLVEMLCILPNLSKIEFQRVNVTYDSETSLHSYNKVFKLKNLKELEIRNCKLTNHFFKIFVHVENLEKLFIRDYVENVDEVVFWRSEYRSLVKFLCQQKSLKVLYLDSTLNANMFNVNLKNSIGFQLTKLSIRNFEKCRLEYILQFLVTQKSLERFEVDLMSPAGEYFDEIFQYILGLETLKDLRLNVVVSDAFKYKLKHLDSFIHCYNSLRTLTLDYCNQSFVDAKEWNEELFINYLVGAFPNIRKFSLFHYGDSSGSGFLKISDLSTIKNWKHLEELEIETFDGKFLRNIELENLVRLKCCLKDVSTEDWEIFVQNNTSIKSLEIEINSISNSTLDIITKQLTRLEKLSLSSFCYNLKDINEDTIGIVCNNCQNLKQLSLELPSTCENLKSETIIVLKSKAGLDFKFSYYRENALEFY